MQSMWVTINCFFHVQLYLNSQFGHIHFCAKQMVLEKFDEKTWAKILNSTTKDFQLLKGYPDRKTFLLIETISKVVGKPMR
uniref:HNOB domain-containing protein n=1 Tax=Macrostomum lignano TaxID=282301 RepID=A0A1I8FC57_9PLAT